MNLPLLILVGTLLVLMFWAGREGTNPLGKSKVTTQRHTGKEVKRWLELNPTASLEEIERKVKDIEIQQPFVSRPVLKMKESVLDNILRQYPDGTETAEYLVILVDSSGEVVTDIRYEQLATVFPLDVYIV